jgi:hypothetical protein
MRGHVVIAFKNMDEMRGTIRDEMVKMGLKIAPNIRVGVLVEGEGGGGVLKKEMGKTHREALDLGELSQNLGGHPMKTTGSWFEDNLFLEPHRA